MKKGFEFISETAGVRMRAWGKTLQELFCNSLSGMASCVKSGILETKKKEQTVVQNIRVEAVDIASLLVEFLSSAVAHADAHTAVFVGATFNHFGENFLEGTLRGIPVEQFDTGIKAVSYRDVNVAKNLETGMYETVLVFET